MLCSHPQMGSRFSFSYWKNMGLCLVYVMLAIYFIFIQISLKFVGEGRISYEPIFVQIMVRRTDHKPLSEPIERPSLLTHTCVTRPLWITIFARKILSRNWHPWSLESLLDKIWPVWNMKRHIPSYTKIQHEAWPFCCRARVIPRTYTMTSSNGNIFRVTGPLCGEFTGHRWIPITKASDAELWCFLWSAPE